MRIFYIIICFLSLFYLHSIAIATENNVVAKVKTKSGKNYTFIKEGPHYSFRIAEWHDSERGYMGGSVFQSFQMFGIEIDYGEFKRKLDIKEVKSIKFVNVGKNEFKIDIITNKGKTLNLLLQGEYLSTNSKDGIEGYETEFGFITIPFSKIDTINIYMPKQIHYEYKKGWEYTTKAKPYKNSQ